MYQLTQTGASLSLSTQQLQLYIMAAVYTHVYLHDVQAVTTCMHAGYPGLLALLHQRNRVVTHSKQSNFTHSAVTITLT
jgi:hypothetical protein